jgi:hypothetical protein
MMRELLYLYFGQEKINPKNGPQHPAANPVTGKFVFWPRRHPILGRNVCLPVGKGEQNVLFLK